MDEGLDLSAIYNPLLGIRNFSVPQTVTSQRWWNLGDSDEKFVSFLTFFL